MTERQRPVHNFLGDPRFTEEQIALIDERERWLRSIVIEAFDNPYYSIVVRGEQGNWVHRRMLGFGRSAIINAGRMLLDYWPALKAEALIPWQVHRWESSDIAWRAVSTRLESTFYRTRTDGGDDTSQRLYGGRWVPELVTGMPGFGAIPEEDVLHWLGPIGGRLPTVDRPTVVFVDRGVSVRAGNSITALLLATGGVPPYAFRLLTETYPWVTLRADAAQLVSTPPDGTAPGDYEVRIEAMDQEGGVAVATITITVT